MAPNMWEEKDSLISEKEDYELDTRSISSSSSSTAILAPTEKYYDGPQDLEALQKLQGIVGGAIGGAVGGVLTRIHNINLPPFILVLLPSFFRSSAAKAKLHPTSWLDGLRGVASFFVYIHHFILNGWFPVLSRGYASDAESYNFFQWPFVRIIYSGRGMVCIFFVISGYVLSYSALRKIRNREFTALLDTLASSTFRRGVRLFLPVLVAIAISLAICRSGGAVAPWGGPGIRGSFMEQLRETWRYFMCLANPVQGIAGNTVSNCPSLEYVFQLWTIPREFRGSIFIYLMLLCLAKCRQSIRVVLVAATAHYFLYTYTWDFYLFLMGMLFAELQFIRQDWANNTTTSQSLLWSYVPEEIIKYRQRIVWTITATVLIFSLHLLCYPDEKADSSPGYIYLQSQTPAQYSDQQRYWNSLGAVLFVGTLTFCPSPIQSSLSPSPNTTPLLQRPFNTTFAQYLAQISYALYAIHGFVLFTLGNRFIHRWNDVEGSSKLFWFSCAVVVNTFCTLWAADVFWRLVDIKSVNLGKWLADRCFVK